ncbi:MAG TPA: vitamin K epoxide reductase family protein [Candidatus Saccharimonadales bacterium]|nr:vitamin K epoxide reductase family protein [Candidatus Saccharimonadales bacterium]
MLRITWQKALPYILLIGGVIGLLASFILTYDKIQLLQDPNYRAACNLNPVVSCGSIMKMPQANLFGVPNTIYGLIVFSMLTMLGLALLAGATFKRWLWLAIQSMATVGVIFMHYLFFEAVFRIHAICPWCFIVWMVTIPIFFSITICNIRTNTFGNRWQMLASTMHFIDRYNKDILVLWYLVIFVILGVKFWYYWSTLL